MGSRTSRASGGHGDAPNELTRPSDSAPAGNEPEAVPADFLPVPEQLPVWIDIQTICKDAKRFVALHALSTFNAVAINDGQRVYTASDRSGEFRRLFGRVVGEMVRGHPDDAALVYDCVSNRQWLAPRPSAMRFLSLQFN